ncbi:TraB/VirB10 family protein [Thiohalocapsa sp.]|uniref:TraB/VirB10 family protein n=1 Tax=Thiohalocapsa sp. TaxID=2497641 RepID=UPI0025D2BBDE|nr:TraB/VirB10 family protein [Thiohalocapsa sp.]
MSIRTVAGAGSEAGRASNVRKPKQGEVFIPAGTILSGVLLNGSDMPTGQQARDQPTPVLIRIKDLAILPNQVRTDVRECFLITSGFGDLASERAYLRGETFSCVRSDGGVIEVALDGYAVGEDGKVGMRGRLVSKQGAMLAKALQAGFLQSFAQIFQSTPAIPITNATEGGDAQFLSFANPDALGAGVASGVGGAMNRLANFYLDMADQMFPVIEVDAGRGVEFILNRGAALKIRS